MMDVFFKIKIEPLLMQWFYNLIEVFYEYVYLAL